MYRHSSLFAFLPLLLVLHASAQLSEIIAESRSRFTECSTFLETCQPTISTCADFICAECTSVGSHAINSCCAEADPWSCFLEGAGVAAATSSGNAAAATSYGPPAAATTTYSAAPSTATYAAPTTTAYSTPAATSQVAQGTSQTETAAGSSTTESSSPESTSSAGAPGPLSKRNNNVVIGLFVAFVSAFVICGATATWL